MEPGRDPAGAQGAHAMASPETVSFYCHTCAARLELPAPSSPFHFTLCPRCRRDYLDDSPDPHRVPWPPAPFTPSTPPPIPCVSSSWSSFTTARPRTLVSPSTGPSSSSTRPPATSSGSAASPTAPVPSSYCPERSAACREFRLLCSHEEQRRPSPAVSPLSSPYSTACSSPVLASPPPPPPPLFHSGELLSESFPLTLRSSTAEPEETTSPPQDLLPPPPPPWLPLAPTWDEYFLNPSDSDDDSPPQPPPPPHVSIYNYTMFDMPLQVQRGGSQAAAASVAANHTVFEFDAPLQRGGSQAAPPESIAALPTVTVTDAGLDCVVCTDPLPPSAPARRLPCGHLYHSHCIVRWLSEHSNSCPVCRRSIPTITSATSDIPSSSQSSGGRRRRSLPVPGGRRIRRICSRLLRNMEIGRDRQTSSSRDRQANSSGGDVHV